MNFENLNEAVLYAFKNGSDYFGEKIVGVSDRLTKEVFSDKWTIINPQGEPSSATHDYYTLSVKLENSDGSPCASGVGIYVKDNMMSLCSGHFVIRDYPLTKEIAEELAKAPVVDRG